MIPLAPRTTQDLEHSTPKPTCVSCRERPAVSEYVCEECQRSIAVFLGGADDERQAA